MKTSRILLSLAMILASLLLLPGLSTGAAGTLNAKQARTDPALVNQLRNRARGAVDIGVNASTDQASFIKVGQNGDLMPRVQTRAAAKADAFIARYGAVLGADVPAQLVETANVRNGLGGRTVTYQQEYKGIPVFAAVVKAHLDEDGSLTAVNGTAVPAIDVGVTPRLSAADAGERAVAHVRTNPPEGAAGTPASTDGIRAESSDLTVYRVGLTRDVAGTNQLVYRVEVTNQQNIRDIVFVHAHAGKVVNRYSLVHDALDRRLYEQRRAPEALIWQEGDATATLNPDQKRIVDGTGESFWFFQNGFGRDSYDGAGHEMESVNNDPTISCPNANWNGITTNYCNGVTADDVVAHEWGHAYTAHTHDLIYQWQSGALNESYSDIWGEVVDSLNKRGTDSPAAARTSGVCSSNTAGTPEVMINSPQAIAGLCAAAPAQFGPDLRPATRANVVLADDGTLTTTDACEPLVNPGRVAGNIALVDRGTCAFTVKVKNAQDAGAVGVLVGQNSEAPLGTMAGSDPTITIPSVMISREHRNLINGQIAGGTAVNVTMRLTGGVREDSFRWLVGEDAAAFGGAIRDMWSPTCLGDPGKVTDAEYHCDASDGGGVHSNSGVPNHGFSLLVDGGSYNGVTVPAVGATKAAHMYFRAMTAYQTPATDFADHADALEASCNDLIGQDLKSLGVTSTPTGPSGEQITAGDCAAVGAMIAAVELRSDPTQQCNFQPLLDPNTPRLCAAGQTRATLFREDFEDGLNGWTLTNQGVFAGWPGFDWEADSTLPGGRVGSAAFGVDPRAGTCDGAAGDVSGVLRMQSPDIDIAGNARRSPRLTFDHYVSTELSFDGGNVKVSVNGGAFAPVPAAAFTFNAPDTLATAAAGNSNPLAGQPGFTGTDGGKVTGSWGQSQVDLTMANVNPGDTISLRFDMGMDGCGGVEGWYVDNVRVSTCGPTGGATGGLGEGRIEGLAARQG